MSAVCAAWYAGFLAGSLALCVGALISTTLFPVGGFANTQDPNFLVGILVYLVFGEIVVALVSAQLYQRRRVDRYAQEAASRREWLQVVLSSIGDAVIVLDLDQRVIEMNRVAERLTGWSNQEAVGREIFRVAKLIGEDTQRTAEHSVMNPVAIKQGQLISEPALLVTRSGVHIPVDVRQTTVQSRLGPVEGYALVIRDETGRRSAERALKESESNFHTLADNISQFAWMADETGSRFWFNQRWLDYTGLTLEETVAWGWKAAHHPDHVDRVTSRYHQCILRGEVWEDTFPLRGKDGNYRWFLSHARPVRDSNEKIIRWFGTNTDITELRRLEESLREADRRKDDYLAMLAHELRNPLAAVRSSIDVLRLEGSESVPVIEIARTREKQLDLLVRIIDDLLDLSRIGHGKLRLQRHILPISEIISVAVSIARPAIDAKGHSLTVSIPDDPVYVNADPTRLAQVISNILLNAAKYTNPCGEIHLRAERSDAQVLFRVRDNGVGLKSDMLTRVFEPFQQVRTRFDRADGGLGLGLTLVKSLVEMHGGHVTAHSAGIGTGCEFVISLPAIAPSGEPHLNEAANLSRSPGQEQHHGRRILIADDNHEAATSLARVVRLLGHDVHVVSDGLAALETLLKDSHDIAILDICMPKLSGHDVAREARRNRAANSTLLVALTGWGKPQDFEQSKVAGFDHHLVKPVELRALRSILDGPPVYAIASE
jgi:PAS domain S-box-containing protein